MAVVTIFSASHCHGEEVAAQVASRLGYRLLSDETLIGAAAAEFNVAASRLERTLRAAPGFFNRLTREKEHCVALLRVAALEIIQPDDLVYHGFGGLLLPNTLTHLLRVCLAAAPGYRLQQAEQELRRREAQRQIEEGDDESAEWTKFLFELGPWDKSLYDVFLAMQSVAVEEAVHTLCDYARRPVFRTTERARQAWADARLAAQVNLKLVEAGHDTDVVCQHGAVTILIRTHTMRMLHLQEKLVAIAKQVPEVGKATARPGPRCREPSVYAPLDVDIPSKVLLVDDEREFVNALSERLQTRSMQPAVAYAGEEALAMVEADQPEVMVLDLKMPGIDGLEVLRRMKQRHPETEVVILTGHGSDAEEALAAQLGAFAYLRKPVDIEVLTEAMKKAYAKVSAAKLHHGDTETRRHGGHRPDDRHEGE
jgi:two-component system response regulator CpxR